MLSCKLQEMEDAPDAVKAWLRGLKMPKIRELALRAHLENTENGRGTVSVRAAASNLAISKATAYRILKNGHG
jgi:hypothetical protein